MFAVRQQLQIQIQSVTFDLEAARKDNELLASTVDQQRKSLESPHFPREPIVVEGETLQQTLESDQNLQSQLESVLANLKLEQERASGMDATVKARDALIHNLQAQLAEAHQMNAQHAETVEHLESIRQQLRKETLRTAELTSVLHSQEEMISTLHKELDAKQDQRARESATQSERIVELEAAYSDQVKKNHEQYIELEEAMDEREAKFSERISELESESNRQRNEIAGLRERASRSEGVESGMALLRQELGQTKAVLEEREAHIRHMAETVELQAEQLSRRDDALAALKRQAADDVFKSTKQERRIEKLLHDREMLNIAVEQLQIHIQLVSCLGKLGKL